MADEERYWICDSANEDNKLDQVQTATGFQTVGIVDEVAGGIIAYASNEYADEICHRLNASTDGEPS